MSPDPADFAEAIHTVFEELQGLAGMEPGTPAEVYDFGRGPVSRLELEWGGRRVVDVDARLSAE